MYYSLILRKLIFIILECIIVSIILLKIENKYEIYIKKMFLNNRPFEKQII